MNPVAEDILSYYGISEASPEDLEHYGVKGRSGRYAHGWGENPHQHCGDFIIRVKDLKSKGYCQGTRLRIHNRISNRVSDG